MFLTYFQKRKMLQEDKYVGALELMGLLLLAIEHKEENGIQFI